MLVRRYRLVALMAIALLVLAGCNETVGNSDDDAVKVDEVTVALDWYPWANHTGLFLAENGAHYDDENLEVDIHVPANPQDVLQLVGTGQDTFGISYQTDVMLARAQGIPVLSIMALVQHPLNSVMTLESSGIERPSQLAGKRVGYPGIPSNEGMLATMLETDGVSIDDVELVNVGFDLVPALIGERVDAIIGAYWVHESILAERQGHPVNIMRVEEWGVPDFYELVLVASEETIAERPEMVERFVQATIRGYEMALNDRAAAVEAILNEYPETDRSLEEESIELLHPLWTDGVPAFGWQTAERWESYAAWMTERGLLEEDVDPSDAFTDQFVTESD